MSSALRLIRTELHNGYVAYRAVWEPEAFDLVADVVTLDGAAEVRAEVLVQLRIVGSDQLLLSQTSHIDRTDGES